MTEPRDDDQERSEEPVEEPVEEGQTYDYEVTLPGDEDDEESPEEDLEDSDEDSVDDSDDEYNPLSDGSLVERIGSFVPSRRPGYPNNRRERKIRRSVGRRIYSKRFEIARHIVDSDLDDPKEVLVSSLVSVGIAPSSATRWTDYVMLLATREGGWDRFLDSLDREVYFVTESAEQFTRLMATSWAMSILLILLATVSPLPPMVSGVVIGVTLALVSGYLAWMITPASAMLRRARSEVMGPRNKSVDKFAQSDTMSLL